MNHENIVTINYKNAMLEHCIFKDNKFIVDNPISDTKQCDIGISLIKRYDIKQLVLSTSCSLRIYKIFKTLDIEIYLIEDKYFSAIRHKSQNDGMCMMSIGCLNATVRYIEVHLYKQYIGQFVWADDNNIVGHVGKYKVIRSSFNLHMYIDAQTIKDLELDEVMRSLNYTKTAYGKINLKSIINFPLKTKREILYRHKMIKDIAYANITHYLKNIKNIFENGTLVVFCVPEFLSGFIQIGKKLSSSSLRFANLDKFIDLYRQIDIFSGKELQCGIFPKYDHLVKMYTDLPIYLSRIVQQMVPKCNTDFSIVYLPHLGYLLEVDKYEDTDSLEVIDFRQPGHASKRHDMYGSIDKNSALCESVRISDSVTTRSMYKSTPYPRQVCDAHVTNNTRYKFTLDDKMYIKTHVMVDLDDEFGDLSNLIQEFKEEKINEVRKLVYQCNIEEACDYIGMVDSINALFLYASKHNCYVPKICDQKHIIFTDFYDYKCDVDIKSSMIYNGTCSLLRMVGQIVHLFHIGSFVPCKFAEICIFDKLITTIDVEESLITGTSYFLASVKSISRMVREATENSLCLMGDLGYGTNYADGLAFFFAVHKYLKDSLVISTCLYREIFEHGHLLQDDGEQPVRDDEKIAGECLGSLKRQYETFSGSKVPCLCEWYTYTSVKISNKNLTLGQIKPLDIDKICDGLDISEEFRKNLTEYYDRLEQDALEVPTQDDGWARQIINEFLRKHKKLE